MSVAEPEATLLPSIVGVRRRARGMSVGEAFRLAFMGLIANKLRSMLTMLGIIIGVSSVIVMVGLGQGVAEATQATIRKLGTNVLTVMPNSQMRGGVSQGLGTTQTLKLEDVEVIKRLAASIKEVVPEYRGSGTVKYQNQNTRTTIFGASPPYFEVRNLPLAQGRFFTADDVKRKAKVCVLGDSVRENLFGGGQAVGKTVKLNGQSFRVVGATQKRGGMMFRNPDDQVTIPITTALYRVFGVDYLGSLSIQAVSESKMQAAQEDVQVAIARAHKLANPADADVRVFSQADLSESAAQQSQFLTMLLAGIALVSLIVGGIGIMNIMLVSVTERTREIGIRKALGAKRRDVLNQFLIESVTLSVVGGLIGIGLGIGVGLWMGKPNEEGGLGFPMMLSATPMVVSFLFSAFVGVFFGIYPAMKASRLDPIDALRYE